MKDGKVALESKLRRRRRDLALAIRLYDAARHERINVVGNRVIQNVVEFAELVAAEAQAGSVFSLHPNARTTKVRG
jgi:hypothetical protein